MYTARKQSSDKLSKIASKALRGQPITQEELKSMAASVLSQDEIKGTRNRAQGSSRSVLEIFWDIVEQIKARSGPMDPINNMMHPLNSMMHPLRSPMHELNGMMHGLNNMMNNRRGVESAKVLQQLLKQYVIDALE